MDDSGAEDPSTAEDLLGIREPAVLFPDTDPRARQRRYARLVRRFRPDREPEAFAHLRSLYEGLTPTRPKDGTERQADPTRATPAEALATAFLSERLELVAALLESHEQEVFEVQRGLWGGATRWALARDLRCLSAEGLTRVVARLEAHGEPGNELEIERMARVGLALRAMADDSSVPTAVSRPLCHWTPDLTDPDAAFAMLTAIGRATADLEQADRLWDHVATAHPAVMVVLHDLGGVLRRVSAPPRHARPPARLPDPDPRRLSRTAQTVAVGAAMVAAVTAGGLLGSLYAGPALAGFGGMAGMMVARRMQGRIRQVVLERAPGLPARERRRRAELEDVCREHGLFPEELGSLYPLPPLTAAPAWPDGHLLPRIAADPGGLARVLSDAHRARWTGP